MLLVEKRDEAGLVRFWLTLQELTTIANPNYLFIAKGKGTTHEIAFVMKGSLDVSPDKARINCMPVLLEQFADVPTGTYEYNVYQQESEENLDPDLSAGLVETGLLKITVPHTMPVKAFDASVEFMINENE